MSQLLIITLIAVGVSVLLLGIRVFFTKRWGFPSSHVEDQPELRRRGFTCHRNQHQEAQHRKNLFDLIAEQEA